jgi:fido (protein-threonine AMPylation protein)
VTFVDPGFCPTQLCGRKELFSLLSQSLESSAWKPDDRLRAVFDAYAAKLVERSTASSTQASEWQQAAATPQPSVGTAQAMTATKRVLTAWIAAPKLDARIIEKGHRLLFAGDARSGFRTRGDCRIRCRHSGAVIYTPPAADRLSKLMDNLVDFIATDQLPGVSKAFIAMLQFLLIHPFTDGNGRSARLLFAGICARGGCNHPIALLALARLYGRGGTRLHAGSAVLRATGSWQSYLDSCARSVDEASVLWQEHVSASGLAPELDDSTDDRLDSLWWRAAAGS